MAGDSNASPAKSLSGAIYDRFMNETSTLRSHATAFAASFEQVSECVKEMLDADKPPQPSSSSSSSRQDPRRELSDAVGGLTQQVARATHTLQSCLQDLTTMGEAVDELIANAPHNEASLLLLNLYGALLRQVGAYYQDVSDAFKGGNAAMEKGRGQLLFSQQQLDAERAVQRGNDDGRDTTRVHDTGNGGEEKAKQVGAAASTSPLSEPTRPTSYTFSQAPVSAVLPVPIPVPADDVSHAAPPSATGSARAKKNKKPTANHTVAHDVGTPQRERAVVDRTGADKTSPVPPAAGLTPAIDELTSYLQVNGTVEEALGPLVLASRPSIFSPIDQLRSKAASATYYVRLVRPGNLTHFVVKNYLDPDEEVQTDLLCEVLETDCVELGTFESTDGEVATPRDLAKARLPMCAWRTCSNEDHSHLLYTMFILLEQPPGTGRTLLVHDAVVTTKHDAEEVLHVVSVVTGAPQFAKVTVYVKSAEAVSGTGAGHAKAAAIVSFVRGMFTHAGFGEVAEEEVTMWLRRQRGARDGAVDGDGTAAEPGRRASTALQMRAQQPPIDATAAFQPNVQLASLDEPGEAGGSTLTFGDVAMGAVRGGLEVLKAPLAVGRAVLGATGVTEAMRSTMAQTFHRSFPQLANEELIESYGCAWQEGSIPKQGNLFITPHWLCFQGSMSNAQFAIEYDEIKDIKKAKTAKVFDNAIEVQTHVNDTYFLSGFLQRDQSYTVIVQQWLKS